MFLIIQKQKIVIYIGVWPLPVFLSTLILESEIPEKDTYERLYGDLSSFKEAQVLKIKFNVKTIIIFRDQITKYFKQNGCPCRAEFGLKCDAKIEGLRRLLAHLSNVEKRLKKCIAFKGKKLVLL